MKTAPIRRAVEFVRSKEWVMFVATVTALLAEAPALGQVVQGELDKAGDKVSPVGLLVLVAGFVARSKVWNQRDFTATAELAGTKLAEVEQLRSDLVTLRAELQAQRGRDLAATEILEAVRQGRPVPGINMAQQPAQPHEIP